MRVAYLLRFLAGLLLLGSVAHAQTTGGVRIGTAGTPNASAVLDLSPDVTTAPKGLLPPRLTLAQRNAIGSPATGLVVYQMDNVPGLYVYNGSIWVLQGDNLGNHTATRNLNLGVNQLVGNGGNQGLSISNNGSLVTSSSISVGQEVITDAAQTNTGTLSGGLRLGGSISGEGLASKRTGGGNQFGLDFYTSSLNRLSITGVGNVGLGTTAPSQLLELAGQTSPSLLLHSSNNNLANGAMLQFRENDLTYGWNLRHNNGGSEGGSTDDRLVLESANGSAATPVMTWNQSSGNVGIGTTTPLYKLEVVGDARVSGTLEVGVTTQVGGTFTIPANSATEVRVSCPAGTTLLGGGGGYKTFDANIENVTVAYSGPDLGSPTTTWLLRVANKNTTPRDSYYLCNCARLR